MTALDIIMRIAHILAAVVALGGVVYGLAVLGPSLQLLDADLKNKLIKLARKRFNRLLHPAIGFLILSGAYNWWQNMGVYGALKETGDKTGFIMLQGMLGLKVLLAVIMFAIVFMQDYGPFKDRPARSMKINLALGILVISLAAVVRYLRLNGGF